MKKKILFFLILILIVLFSCDRYKHNFTTEPNNQITPENFFENFKSVLTRLDTTNIDTLMNYYSEAYLNNGKTKDDMHTFFNSLITDYNFNQLNVDLISLENLKITYKISLIAKVDTLFSKTIDDVLIKTNDSYLFYGNQEGEIEQTKQRVMVILFTGTRCQNCPYAESALEELKAEIGDKFSYAEFHHYMADPLEIPICAELFNYYELSGVPQAIFQGQTIYEHFQDQTTQIYKETILNYANNNAVVLLDSLSYSFAPNIINANIKLTFLENNLEDLKLLAILVEKDSEVLNFNQEHCKQVVYAYSETEIQPTNGYVNFIISQLPEIIPDDSQIIIWIQTLKETFSQNECKIYNVMEKDIVR